MSDTYVAECQYFLAIRAGMNISAGGLPESEDPSVTVTDNGHHRPRLLKLGQPDAVVVGDREPARPTPGASPIVAAAPRHQNRATQPAATALPAGNLATLPTRLPLLWHWLAIVATSLWLATTARESAGFIPAIVLLVIAGATQTVIELRASRRAVSARLGYTLANGMTLVAIAIAGIVATTTLNPTLVVLPIIVWTFAANSNTRQMSTAITVGAGLLALLIAGAGITANNEPVVPALILAGTSALASAAAAWHGKQVAASVMQTVTASTAASGPDQSEGPARLIQEARAAITAQHDPVAIARIGIQTIERAFHPSFIAVVEAVPGETITLPISHHSKLVEDPERFQLRLVNITLSAMAERKPTWIIDDGSNLEAIAARKMGIEGLLVVPLNHLNREVGAVQIAWEHLPDPTVLSEALAFTTELAYWLTPDLAIAQYATVIERGYFDAMSTLSATIDSRQRFTWGHSKRVAKLALGIADQLGLDEDEQRKLLYAAELHDIGRVGVSDDILGKPEALTGEEIAIIREIPRLSADLVEPVSFFTDVHTVILHQHERWDGKGHPHGLSGEEIPLLSRILAIADAYDAMTSRRPYREALPERDALIQIWRERSHKYDPAIVEAFVVTAEADSPHGS